MNNEDKVTVGGRKEWQKQNLEAALIKKLEAEGWTYRKDLSYVSIKVLEGHWREVLNENNAYKLNGKPLSDVEFGLVMQEVQRIKTPYDAQLLLVGAGGVGSIPITRDDGSNLEVEIFMKMMWLVVGHAMKSSAK